jgi:[pyruvate, water dikinase]-phosphate phosphotransferase / [pyruvate, water dikinase] kinase
MVTKRFHVHLVSDATGETLESVAKACLAQYEGIEIVKHFWPMVRSERQLDRVIEDIIAKPGLVLFTMVNPTMRDRLQTRCRTLSLPAIAVLDPVLAALNQFFGEQAKATPGKQHAMDAAYFRRIDAVHYTMAHDDGQLMDELDDADILLLGVSRTSKTPTSMYLANRGYKTGNIPLVPGVPLPESVFALKKPLIVGLTANPDRLIQVRRNRLRSLNQTDDSDYVRSDSVEHELQAARRLFSQHGVPVIDVTRRSIEEAAAAIINLYNERHGFHDAQ